MTRLLVVCGEPLGARMAGPAIRSVELANALARAGHTVNVAAPRKPGYPPLEPGVGQLSLDSGSLRRAMVSSDAILAGAGLLARFPVLLGSSLPLAVDLYDPVPLEAAELFRGVPDAVRRATMAEAAASVRLELGRADLVVCASERQREFWHGAIVAAGVLTPRLYDADPALARHVAVVPFGVPAAPPARGQVRRLRGVVPGIAEADQVALWAGGLHEWFDPELAVRAAAAAASRHPRLRLVFMGADPPNAALQRHAAAGRARRVADELGLTGTHVFFQPGWVPYVERGEFLAEADVGISCHHDTLETRYAWRTRLLDYIWAGLPVACTGGDALGDLLGARGAGTAVRPGDLDGFTAGLVDLLEEPSAGRARAAAAALAEEFQWDRVVAPLTAWLERPQRSGGHPRVVGARLRLARMLALKAAYALRTEGPAGVLRRARRYRDT